MSAIDRSSVSQLPIPTAKSFGAGPSKIAQDIVDAVTNVCMSSSMVSLSDEVLSFLETSSSSCDHDQQQQQPRESSEEDQPSLSSLLDNAEKEYELLPSDEDDDDEVLFTPSGLCRDSSSEFPTTVTTQKKKRARRKNKLSLRLPTGGYACSDMCGARLEAMGHKTEGGKLSLAHRFEAYLTLRKYAHKGRIRRFTDEMRTSTFDSDDTSPESPTPLPLREHVYVSLEGNIGVGKTTMCDNLRFFVECMIQKAKFNGCLCDDHDDDNNNSEARPICHVDDVVEYIEEKVDENWLLAFFEDKQGMSTLFQFERLFATINAAKTMGATMAAHAAHGKRVHCIGDRLPLGNFAFATMHYANGNIPENKYKLYGITLANAGPYAYPDIAYLHCPVDIVKNRIAQRNRPGETAAYSTDYLEQLDEANLFVMLYMWYTGVIDVSFFDWSTFQKPKIMLHAIDYDKIWRRTNGKQLGLKEVFSDSRKRIRHRLLTMSYDEMKEIASLLSWKGKIRGRVSIPFSSVLNPETLRHPQVAKLGKHHT